MVETDVFVDFTTWYNNKANNSNGKLAKLVDTWLWALVVECKFCAKTSSAANDWPLYEIKKISDDVTVKKNDIKPLLVSKDKWHWIRLEDLAQYFVEIAIGDDPNTVINNWNVKHINRDMSEFFKSAFEQAANAKVPNDYHMVLRIVCVGSNAHLPKVVGISPKAIKQLKDISQEAPYSNEFD